MPSLLVTNNKISGMVSGLDTDTIIKGLLSSYQTKIDKLGQSITKDEWTQDAYREVNTLLKNFRTKYMSVLSGSNMMSSTAYEVYKATVITGGNAVTVTAGSGASPSTFTIDSVSQLAAAAAAGSADALTGTYDKNTKLSELSLANPLEFDEEGKITFSINGTDFSFDGDTTIGSMMSQINASNAGVRMSYSELTNGFTIQSTATGSTSTVEIINGTGNAFSAEDGAFGIAEGVYTGQDAILSINGRNVVKSSNKFTIDGVTYNLNDTSASAIKFSVTQDIDTPVQKIKDFVNAYNDLVDTLQNKIKEKYDSSYPPLTDAQKEKMSEDEIANWTAKAKTGLLYNNSYISSLLQTMRNALYTAVESAGMSPSDIGLNTGAYTDGAKITLNEDKLRAALAKDPQKVTSVLVNAGSSSSDQGFIMRISNAMLSCTKNMTNIALDGLEKEVATLKNKQSDAMDKMDEESARLYDKFSKMESALAKLNSMSVWLNSFFSS